MPILHEICRLGLPPAWIYPTMLDIIKTYVHFDGCFEDKQSGRNEPSLLACLAAGHLAGPATEGILFSPEAHVGGSRIVFHRSGGRRVFGSEERRRLESATGILAAAAARQDAYQGTVSVPVVAGSSGFLLVDGESRVVGISESLRVLKRSAIALGVRSAAAAHGAHIDRGDAQALWDVVRFRASASKELQLAGPWGAFSFRPSPTINWDAAASPAVIVTVTERISKALLGIGSLSKLNLSPREVEACRWLLEGFAKPEIAERMRVAESTVRSSVKSIYTRLGVASREQLLDLALRSN